MAIYRGSRYESSVVDFIVLEPNGDALPVVFYEFSEFGFVPFIEHRVEEGERLDQISNKYYKTPNLWWLIPEFNPQIKDTVSVPAGTIVRILLNV